MLASAKAGDEASRPTMNAAGSTPSWNSDSSKSPCKQQQHPAYLLLSAQQKSKHHLGTG